MASLKFSLDRLRRKYNYTGGRLQDLMKKVIGFNQEKITNKVARITRDQMSKSVSKLGTKEKKIIMPELNEILPGRSVFFRKAAEKGTRLTDTLRDRLNKDIRDVMQSEGLIARTGITAGSVKRSTIKKLESRIKETFQNYTKKDPKFGIPSNIHTIAVTEVRATVNSIKNEYAEKLALKNGLIAKKKWIHNKSLSKKPRPHHMRVNGKVININETFKLKNEKGNIVELRHPHDPLAPASEVISCNCDIDYIMRKKE